MAVNPKIANLNYETEFPSSSSHLPNPLLSLAAMGAPNTKRDKKGRPTVCASERRCVSGRLCATKQPREQRGVSVGSALTQVWGNSEPARNAWLPSLLHQTGTRGSSTHPRLYLNSGLPDPQPCSVLCFMLPSPTCERPPTCLPLGTGWWGRSRRGKEAWKHGDQLDNML